MPWTMDNYPSSLKNLDKAVRKKAIEISNALVQDGYDEGEAIPIATSQAKEWVSNATKKEREYFLQHATTSPSSKRSSNRPELLDRPLFVTANEEGNWVVQTEGAKQPAHVFNKKEDAVKRAKEIANNKQTQLMIHRKDDTVEEKINYEK